MHLRPYTDQLCTRENIFLDFENLNVSENQRNNNLFGICPHSIAKHFEKRREGREQTKLMGNRIISRKIIVEPRFPYLRNVQVL